jgi:putative ABC transport system ATP-binding protein
LRVGGLDISRLPEAALADWRAANVGFIFQFYNLMPVLTAFENVELPLMLTRLSRAERRERVDMVLGMVNLADRMSHYPSELSGGQQQRVAIARALAMKPQVLLLDEITSALDPELVAEVEDVIRALTSEGIAMVLVTHAMAFAREIAHRIAYLADGRIAEIGRPEDVLGRPRDPGLQEFLRRIR